MGLEKNWGITIGTLESGSRNLISDVEGVTVGHCTLDNGSIQTGVTAIRPHPGNTYKDKVLAACHVINGFGKSAGLIEIEEMGVIETPIMLTNTLSVGTVSTGTIRYLMAQNPDLGDTTASVNPIVCECNDSTLNDMRGLHVKEEHVMQALSQCDADFAEGAVGAGRGMKCHELKGGIGSASRIFELDGKKYTLGVLTMTNHALYKDLMINGDPVGQRLERISPEDEDKGSVITVIATDVPLSERQLKRLCARAVAGLSRTGSHMGNGSGEIVLAFTTANRRPHYPETDILNLGMVHDDRMNMLFRAVIECTEEAVLSSMLHADRVTGRNGVSVPSLKEVLCQDKKYALLFTC